MDGSAKGTGLVAWACLSLLAVVAFLWVAAPSADADSCPNAEFRKGAGALLPDCRAYERVSPAQKNGGRVGRGEQLPWGGGAVAEDGNAAAYISEGAFDGAVWGGAGELGYISRRTGDSWETNSIGLPTVTGIGILTQNWPGFSPDLRTAMMFSSLPVLPGTTSLNNFYLQDTKTNALTFQVSTPQNFESAVVSRDLSHLAVDTQSTVTSEPGQPDFTFQVYEAFDGQIRLVSREPGTNAPFQGGSFLGGFPGSHNTQGAVSDDGRHIFFYAEGAVYRRTDGETTELASPSQRTLPDPTPNGKYFQLATPDGDRVFFTSRERLTDDANDPAEAFSGDLYRYDFEEDKLVDLSAGTQGSEKADVYGVLGAGDGGDHVYFVADGQVVPNEGTVGDPNLYLWEDDGTPDGRVRFIATLSEADAANWDGGVFKPSRVTPDGQHLLFTSSANLIGYDSLGTEQIYLYDAAADGGTGRLECLSCPTSAPTGSARPLIKNTGTALGGEYPLSISDDGRTVLFNSSDALLPVDTNQQTDAYLWEDGDLFLLSTGRGGGDSYVYGMSPSGDEVFFRTADKLVPADADTLLDLYTARVGGGLLSQQNPPAPDCRDEACQPAAPPPLGSGELASGHGASSGGPAPQHRCKQLAHQAKKVARRARHLRAAAGRADGQRAAGLRRQGREAAKQARELRRKAQRCAARAPGAGR